MDGMKEETATMVGLNDHLAEPVSVTMQYGEFLRVCQYLRRLDELYNLFGAYFAHDPIREEREEMKDLVKQIEKQCVQGFWANRDK